MRVLVCSKYRTINELYIHYTPIHYNVNGYTTYQTISEATKSKNKRRNHKKALFRVLSCFFYEKTYYYLALLIITHV